MYTDLKKCEFCVFEKNTVKAEDIREARLGVGGKILFCVGRKDSQSILVATKGKLVDGLTINYCPICGRALYDMGKVI